MTAQGNLNTYTLLASFLKPDKSGAETAYLSDLIQQGKTDWGIMLYQADQQFAIPLWRTRLEKDGLLSLPPQDFQDYLTEFTALNRERNAELMAGLDELLDEFAKLGVEPLLIKGAAALATNL